MPFCTKILLLIIKAFLGKRRLNGACLTQSKILFIKGVKKKYYRFFKGIELMLIPQVIHCKQKQ